MAGNGIVEANGEISSSTNLEEPKNDSQTASEYIDSQLQLEAEAREALPYSFEHCTKPLGPLKQNIYSCLTCNPVPEDKSVPYNPAGICYACSISCHGEHTLVELFAHRNFVCDCGTIRIPKDSPCTLRLNEATGVKEPVHSEEAAVENTYNHNFKNYFCGCGELYDAHKQKGTMYQCIGLATEQEGGCGEDWWHPECLKGWPRDWHLTEEGKKLAAAQNCEDGEHPVVPGFREEFETLICYKCVEANPWIKKYATADGFMALPHNPAGRHLEAVENGVKTEAEDQQSSSATHVEPSQFLLDPSKKRKAEDDLSDAESTISKRTKIEESMPDQKPKHLALVPAPTGKISILCIDEDWRSKFCRCPTCYADLRKHQQLLEEEDTYEPPVSEDGEAEGQGSVGTGSLLERGEAALSNVDRVRAIEGVMAYNNLKDKVKSFLKPFAESGEAVSADHIKAYFEKLRGDDQAMKEAALAANTGENGHGGGDNRRGQSGY